MGHEKSLCSWSQYLILEAKEHIPMEAKRNPAPWKSAQGQSSQELGDSLDFCTSYTVGRGFSYAPALFRLLDLLAGGVVTSQPPGKGWEEERSAWLSQQTLH